MINLEISRRSFLVRSAASGIVLLSPALSWASDVQPVSPVETTAGKVSGTRLEGITRFLGVPYGSDTGERRFRLAIAPEPWTGVRACNDYGLRAVQSFSRPQREGGDPNPEYTKFVRALFGGSRAAPEASEGEDCLVLNVWTPEASPQRKRPVLLYLHGGGFTRGSGGSDMFDGTALARRGDAVVITINHRISALGYLYLGEFHEDFADSGNSGQRDIVLALEWVRDNIANFGGDPGNVTIFGQSGGGAKVAALLGMPSARGLFHRAFQQSGTGVTMVERADAVALAEKTLATLGIATSDVHKLQTMDPAAITAAAIAAQPDGLPGSRQGLGPVVDGRSLPAHPFEPTATEISLDVPLVIGSTKDERTFSLAADLRFGKFTVEEARQRFAVAGEKADAAFELYRGLKPDDQPTYWISDLLTDLGTRGASIKEAERKAAQQAAPVFMYRVDWETPIMGGALRSPHGVDTPLVFDNAQVSRALLGEGPEPMQVAAQMSQALVNFAHTGDPSQKGLAWPRYELPDRQTVIFDVPGRVVSDPDRERREFWTA